jgi:hypothetical protein
LGFCAKHSTANSHSATYKQDANGLENQFGPFLKAYHKGDIAGQDEAFKVFQFPDAKSWFGQFFRPEDVQQHVWDDEAEVAGEGKTLARMMTIIKRGRRFYAHCKPYTNAAAGTVKERQSRVYPVKPVPVEQFNIEFQEKDSAKRFSFLGNFVIRRRSVSLCW